MRVLRSSVAIHRVTLFDLFYEFEHESAQLTRAAQIRTRPPFPSVRRYEPSVRRVSDVGSFRTQSPDFFIVVPSARETCGGALAHKSTSAAAHSPKSANPSHVSLWMVRKTLSAQETKQVTGVATCHRFVSYTSCSLAFHFASTLLSAPYAEYSRVLL